MERTDIFKRTNSIKTLASDPIYFKYIFKKTEKITCAVFYILHDKKDRMDSSAIVKDVEEEAQKLLDTSLHVLESSPEEAETALLQIGHKLIALESKLRILNAARLLSNELLIVFQNEIDTLFRSINSYAPTYIANPLLTTDEQLGFREKRLSPTKATIVKDAPSSSNSKIDRRTRVLQLVKEKGQASIKDISDGITDCSEKTIQRELINLIKDGLIVREGERRWSVYKPA